MCKWCHLDSQDFHFVSCSRPHSILNSWCKATLAPKATGRRDYTLTLYGVTAPRGFWWERGIRETNKIRYLVIKITQRSVKQAKPRVSSFIFNCKIKKHSCRSRNEKKIVLNK